MFEEERSKVPWLTSWLSVVGRVGRCIAVAHKSCPQSDRADALLTESR